MGVGAVLLGAGGGCDEIIRSGVRGGWCCVGNVGWGMFLMCVVLLYTRYVITIPDIMLPPSRLGSLMSVRGVEIYSGGF